jgi:tRNA1Val (adenine37-N6)-methyltransferase
LADVVCAAYRLLSAGGRLMIIFSAYRLVDLLTAMRKSGVEPKAIRMIHSFGHTAARLVIAEGVKGGRGQIDVLPPLIIYAEKNRYTQEVKKIFAPLKGDGDEC